MTEPCQDSYRLGQWSCAAGPWRKSKEDRPDPGDEILIFNTDWVGPGVGMFKGDGTVRSDDGEVFLWGDITYWAEIQLPEVSDE